MRRVSTLLFAVGAALMPPADAVREVYRRIEVIAHTTVDAWRLPFESVKA